MQGNPRQSWILDSTTWISDSRYWIPDSLWVELGFRIPIVSGIPNSLNCSLDSKAQDSGFHRQKFLGFTNPDSLPWGDKLFFLHYITSWQSSAEAREDIQHSGPSMAEQLSWCPKVFRATYLCNLVDSLTLPGRSQLFLGMGRRCGSRCGAERSAGCTKYMEPGQLERKNQKDRGLEERTTKNTSKTICYVVLVVNLFAHINNNLI